MLDASCGTVEEVRRGDVNSRTSPPVQCVVKQEGANGGHSQNFQDGQQSAVSVCEARSSLDWGSGGADLTEQHSKPCVDGGEAEDNAEVLDGISHPAEVKSGPRAQADGSNHDELLQARLVCLSYEGDLRHHHHHHHHDLARQKRLRRGKFARSCGSSCGPSVGDLTYSCRYLLAMIRSLAVPFCCYFSVRYNANVMAVVMFVLKLEPTYRAALDDLPFIESTIQTLIFLGAVVGNTTIGYIGDLCGRRAALIAALLIQLAGEVGSAVGTWGSPLVTLSLLGLFRFIVGVGNGGALALLFVVVAESVTTRPAHPTADHRRDADEHVGSRQQDRLPRALPQSLSCSAVPHDKALRHLSSPSTDASRADGDATATSVWPKAEEEQEGQQAAAGRRSAGEEEEGPHEDNMELEEETIGDIEVLSTTYYSRRSAVNGCHSSVAGEYCGDQWSLVPRFRRVVLTNLLSFIGPVSPFAVCAVLWSVSTNNTELNWRGVCAFGVVASSIALFLAFRLMRDSKEYKDSRRQTNLRLALKSKRHWLRLLGTAGCWFLNCFEYYGCVMVQPAIIAGLFTSPTVAEGGVQATIDNAQAAVATGATLNGTSTTAVLRRLSGGAVASPVLVGGGEETASLADHTQPNFVVWENVFVMMLGFPGLLAALYLLNVLGPKRLMLLGDVGRMLFFALMAVSIEPLSHLPWVLIFIFGGVQFFTYLGSLTFAGALPSVTFPAECRSTFSGLSAVGSRLGGVVGIYCFNAVMRYYGIAATMWLGFAGAAALVVLTTFFVLPDEKQRLPRGTYRPRPVELGRRIVRRLSRQRQNGFARRQTQEGASLEDQTEITAVDASCSSGSRGTTFLTFVGRSHSQHSVADATRPEEQTHDDAEDSAFSTRPREA